MIGLLFAVALACTGALAEEAILEAQTIEIVEGVASGTGGVHITIDGERIEGVSFRLNAAAATLEVDEGLWTRADGVLRFERATVDLEDLTGVVLRGEFRGVDSDLVLRGETIEVLDSDHWSAHRVGMTTCNCPSGEPLWQITARRVRVTLDDAVMFWGGWIRAGSLPLIPVPFGRFPLVDSRPRLQFPEVRLTGDGLELAQPVVVPLGKVGEWKVAPRVREQRGFRVDNTVSVDHSLLGSGTLEGVYGYDRLQGAWRGGVQARLAADEALVRHAIDGTWLTDLDLLADFDADYLDRSLDFFERRAWAQVGRFRLFHRSVQSEQTVRQEPLGLAWHDLAVSGRAWDLYETAELWWVDEEQGVAGDTEGRAVAFTAIGATGARALGPVNIVAELGAASWIEDLTAQNASTTIRLAPIAAFGATLPMWADHGALRHLVDPGAGIRLETSEDGEITVWTGPQLTSRWLAAEGAPLAVDFAVLTDGVDLRPEGRAWAQHDAWWVSGSAQAVRGRVESGQWSASGGFDDGERGLTLLAINSQGESDTDALSQVAASTWWTFHRLGDRFTPSAHLRVDALSSSVLERGIGLRFRTRCQCLDIATRASWSEDRPWPELAVVVDIRE